MMIFSNLRPAIFRERQNRFLGLTEFDGKEVECFIPNPGRLEELLRPDTRVYLKPAESRVRKTRFDLVLVECQGNLVSVDSRVPNTVVEEAIEVGLIPEFFGYRVECREPTFDDSRFDFLLTNDQRRVFVEVKSCTLVVDGLALFPDAPTRRGTRHLLRLDDALSSGRSAIIFLIQRGDANALRPNWNADPVFAAAFEKAQLKGVEAYAYDSRVTLEGISINRRVPVKI